MATSTVTPPAGFELEQPTQETQPSQPQTVTPPNGFVLESPAAPPTPTPTPTPQPTATISAIHEPTTFLGKFGRWAENVSNDMKYGTDETGIGTVLKKMGAHGVYMGNPEAVGDFMASLPLGLLKAAKGTSELAPAVIGGEKGRTWQGVKDVVGGGLQAAAIPSAFVAPEESMLSKEGLLNDAASVASKGVTLTKEAVTAIKEMQKAHPLAAKVIKAVIGAEAYRHKQELEHLLTLLP